MSAALIAGILNDRYGFNFDEARVTEVARTPDSTIFEASNDEGAAVQVELFTAPVEDTASWAQLDDAFASVTTDGAFRPRHAGTTEDNRAYVLREASVGTPLARLLADKRAAGTQFSDAETRDLLQHAAQAIDEYNAAGLPNFLARSVTPEAMLVQPSWSAVPVKLNMVGPSPALAAAEDNLHSFWNVIAQLTGKPVDQDAATKYDTAAGYLNAVTAPAEAPQAPIASVAPRPQDGYRKPPEPYPAGAVTPPPGERTRRSPWPWIIAALAIALIAMLAAWWFTTQRGEPWTEAEQEIAETYPGIVPKKGGQKGWQDLRCESATPDFGQDAKIRCAGEELGVTVAKYSSESSRNMVIPGEEYAVVLGSGACMIEDYELPDAYPDAYVMAPRDNGEYLMIVNGFEAEEKRLDLPVCQ